MGVDKDGPAKKPAALPPDPALEIIEKYEIRLNNLPRLTVEYLYDPDLTMVNYRKIADYMRQNENDKRHLELMIADLKWQIEKLQKKAKE